MPIRPKTQDTLILALELLRRIPRNRKVTASDLHDQLKDEGIERELRTIQRQLEKLSEHFDIERDERSKPYGYSWKPHSKGLSVPRLNEKESLLLSLAEQHLRNLLPANLMSSMEGFFEQAKINLAPGTNKKREREWLSKVRVVSTSQPLLPPKIRAGVFDEVSNALYANKWLKIDYENSDGKRGKYDVMPLGLAQQGTRLYLVCRYRGFDNERSVALHRIISAKTSTMYFERPDDFDLQKYDDDGRFGYGEGKRIKLIFKIDKEAGLHLLESPLSIDQLVTENKEEYLISATVVDTAQLDWWLLGFGESVRSVTKIAID